MDATATVTRKGETAQAALKRAQEDVLNCGKKLQEILEEEELEKNADRLLYNVSSDLQDASDLVAEAAETVEVREAEREEAEHPFYSATTGTFDPAKHRAKTVPGSSAPIQEETNGEHTQGGN